MPTVPPPRPAVDPIAYEAHLVAFAGKGNGYVVLERVVDTKPHVAFYEINVSDGTRHLIQEQSEELVRTLTAAWPGSDALGAVLTNDKLGAWLSAQGYVWPTRLLGRQIETPHGTIALEENLTVTLRDAEASVVVARLAPEPAPDAFAWLVSLDRTRVALTARYDGTPQVQDLRVIDLRGGKARLLGRKGSTAHRKHDYRTAASLWREALTLDPEAADLLYNLACAMALQQERNRALELLQTAVEQGGDRYRKLADSDPDLESIWKSEEFARIVERPAHPARD